MYFLLNITQVIFDAMRSLCLFLDIVIYDLIVLMYGIFEKLAVAEFLSNEAIQDIYRKVGLILGLYMVFRLTFSLIKMLIDPDLVADKEKGVYNIIKRIIISVFLMAVTPFIFNEAFEIQRIVVTSNIIGKVIMGVNDNNTSDFGSLLAENVFFSFFKDEIDPQYDPDPGLMNLKDKVKVEGFGVTLDAVNNTETIGGYTIEFDHIVSVLVGAFLLWVIVIYCFAVGRRVIQLAFLQLIAPIPILSYVSDKKETAFSNWVKQCMATYIDLFIRLAIIYFVMYVVSILAQNLSSSTLPILSETTGVETSDPLFTAIVIILICGLLLFAKSAPDMISELFPGLKTKASIGYGFGFESEGAKGLGALLGTTVGSVLGFTTGRGLGRITGALSGAAKGIGTINEKGNAIRNSFNAVKKQVEANEARNARIRGTSTLGRVAEFGHRLGVPLSYLDRQEAAIFELDKKIDSEKFSANLFGLVGKRKSAMKSIAEDELLHSDLSDTALNDTQQKLLKLKAAMETAEKSGDAGAYASAVVAYNKNLKEAKEEFIDAAMKNSGLSGKFTAEYNGLKADIDAYAGEFASIGVSASSIVNNKSLNSAEEAATAESQRHTFNQNEYEAEKTRITSSEKYKRAKANRAAVGGKSKN